MAFSRDPLDELVVPDGTEAQERDLVTDGDVLVGGRSTIEFGVRGRNVLAGESAEFRGAIEADGDCRLDMWCDVAENVLVGQDAYIGERVHIGGKLKVAGDLDIGDDVTIDEGFEANGWILTRNPVPALVFYFIVLSQYLKFGNEADADEFASAITGEAAEQRPPLVIPRGAELSDDAWRVSTPATIGDGCRLHGNIRAEAITVGTDTTVFGSLRAREDIEVGSGTVIIGDVTTRNGTVTLHAGSEVRGDVSCQDLVVHEGADVDGALRAKGDMKLVRQTEQPVSTDEPEPSTDEDEIDTDDETETEETGTETTKTESTKPESTEQPTEQSADSA